MSTEINLEYGDVLKAYQNKVNELMVQLITAEAKLNASAGVVNKLDEQILHLQSENEKLKKVATKGTKKSSAESVDNVVDFN